MKKAVLALSILERGDLWFQYESEENITRVESEASDCRNFGLFVRDHVKVLLGKLRDEHPNTSAADLFNSVATTVVSVPGVVRDNRTLVQVPSWRVSNKLDKSGYDPVNGDLYDFPHGLAHCVAKIIDGEGGTWTEPERKRFEETVFVVNDATTCAIFEYEKRRRAPRSPDSVDIADFAYIVANGGINVGVIGRSYDNKVVVQTNHAEAGHVYVPSHPLDDCIGYDGMCNFHDWCLEGMIGISSISERIDIFRNVERDDLRWVRGDEKGRKRRARYKSALATWRDEAHRLAPLAGRALHDALLRFILNPNSPDDGVGVELLGHYLGLLAHQIFIGPFSPKQVVLDGRMVNENVLRAVRQNVVDSANKYPRRKQLIAGSIEDYLVPSSKAAPAELETIGVVGALRLGFERIRPEEPRMPTNSQVFRGGSE